MKHLNYIQKYDSGRGTLKELAEDVENMSYDAVAEFLTHLSSALYRRSKRDRNNDKNNLAEILDRASFNIDSAALNIIDAWKICEPYMKRE